MKQRRREREANRWLDRDIKGNKSRQNQKRIYREIGKNDRRGKGGMSAQSSRKEEEENGHKMVSNNLQLST